MYVPGLFTLNIFGYDISLRCEKLRKHDRKPFRWGLPVGPPVLYLNNRSHGQNLRSTPGQAELITKYFSNALDEI